MNIKLNLIPEYKKEEIRQQSIFLRIIRWGFEFLAVYVVFILVLFALSYILKLNLQTNIIQLSPNNIARFDEFRDKDTEIKNMNKLIGEIKKIQNGQFYWTKFFAKLELLAIDGVVINDVTTKDFKVLLTGSANTSDNLAVFKDKIVKDSCFTEVDLPLSYLAPGENVDFQMTFAFKKECLKQIDGKQ